MAAEKFAMVVIGSLPVGDEGLRAQIQRDVERALVPLQKDGVYLEGMVLRFGALAEEVPGASIPSGGVSPGFVKEG